MQEPILCIPRRRAALLGAGDAGLQKLRRIFMALDVVAVGELPDEVLVEQRDAVVHVVEDGLHQRLGALEAAVAERLIDLLILFALLVLSAFSIVKTMSTGNLIVTANILGAGIAAAIAVLAGLLGLRLFGSRIERVLPGRTQAFFSRFQTGVLGSFHRQTLPGVSVLTILIWLTGDKAQWAAF